MLKQMHKLRNKILFLSGAFIILFIVFVYLSNKSDIHYNDVQVKALKGQIDISEILNNHSVYALDGEWEFYPNQLIDSKEFGNKSVTEYSTVPGSWSYSFIPNKYKGIATYRLMVKLPDVRGQILGIRTSNIRQDYKLIIDGKEIFANGIFSNKNSPIPAGFPRTSFFEVKSINTEIIIQISNNYLNNPGIAHSVLIGQQEIIRNLAMTKNNMDIILFAALVCVTLILFLYFWIFNSQSEVNLNYLVLAFNTFMFALVTAGYREKLLYQFLFKIDTSILLKIHDLSKVGYYISLYILINTVRKTIYPKIVFNLTLWHLIFILSIVCLLPIELYGAYMDALTFTLYVLFVIYLVLEVNYVHKIRKDIRNTEDKFYVFGLILLPTVYSIGIIIYRSKDVWFDMFISLTIVFFIFFMISRTFIDGVENMRKNHKLAEEVLKNEFAFLQSQIKPHFLFNTLSTIQSMIDIDGQKAQYLLNDLSDYLRNAFEFNHQKHLTSISKELQHVSTYLSIEKERYVDRFKVEIEIDNNLNYATILQYSIQPLVENALRHGILVRSQFGTIHIRVILVKDKIEVHIVDNGVGNEKLASLLNEDNDSRGVGIKNIHKRLLKLYGEGLNVQSIKNKGTHIWFSYPYLNFEEEL